MSISSATEFPSERFASVGRRVIARAAAALSALGDTIGSSFSGAVRLLLAARGRVIVSGIGKSGHIARKIAATFASTGTPAQFVHPAEASHGDLGMMTPGDVALVLSKSGETPELANVIAYTRRFGIPLIAMAERPDSTLVRAADVALLLPMVEEACETGIVPTTSTTMSLALGDALAVALMEHRQFTPADFREFHPGGTLGAQLARVSDLMHWGAALPLAPTGTAMSDALVIMSQKGFGVVGVLGADNALLGVITDGDLRRHMDGLLDQTVDHVMTRNPRTIAPDALLPEALGLMTQPTPRITCLFVCDPDQGPQALGLLHIHDCLRAGVA